MNNDSILWIATETIIFLTFIFVCAALSKSRFTAKKTTIILLAGTVLSTALNAAVFLGSHDLAFTLGKLWLTTYLPAIIVLHLLSDSGFLRTISIWCIGLLGMYAGYLSLKVPFPLYHQALRFLSLPAVIFIICFVTLKYIRKPFYEYIPCSGIDYSLLMSPVLIIFLAVLSYFSNSATNLAFLLFLLVIAVFLMTAKLFWTEYTKQQLNKLHEKYETLIQAQQEEFQEITVKHEQLREYRHDMRHHLLVLGNILRDCENRHAREYFNTLAQRLEHTENAAYCKNQMINAVLSFHITKAKEIGCVLDTHISIPEKTDIEEVDLCIILSNALENAVNACRKEDEEHRCIKIKIDYKNVLTISIKNSCNETVSFDKNGMPKTMPKQGHGIGMRSIANMAQKYGGILKCECADGEFKLNILMFHAAKDEHKPCAMNSHEPNAIHSHQQCTVHICRPAFMLLSSLIGICAFLIVFLTATNTPTDTPIADSPMQVITARRHHSGWGSNEFDVEEPKIILTPFMPFAPEFLSANKETDEVQHTTVTAAAPSAEPSADTVPLASAAPTANAVPAPTANAIFGTPKISETTAAAPKSTGSTFPTLPVIVPENPALEEGAEEINDKMSEYIETLRQAYYWYLNRKYLGYTALESSYSVLCNNEDMLLIKVYGTLNVGGSADFNRYFTLDKRTGSAIELADLFQKGADYITPISSEILKQMTIQVESGNGVYYISGGIWSDDYCFKNISQEQNFYINDQGKLVIAFDEYEVAPGSMGCVEFVIPTHVIDSILSKPSLIQ